MARVMAGLMDAAPNWVLGAGLTCGVGELTRTIGGLRGGRAKPPIPWANRPMG